jgi:hypothetical protein
MWMLMEGVLQYLLFVKVLRGAHFSRYLLKTAIPAWGKILQLFFFFGFSFFQR